VKAAALNRCPVADCKARPAPLLCGEHWPHVSSPTRRALVTLWRSLSGNGVKDAPARLLALSTEATRDVARSLVTQLSQHAHEGRRAPLRAPDDLAGSTAVGSTAATEP
jgi:hypothetical protein